MQTGRLLSLGGNSFMTCSRILACRAFSSAVNGRRICFTVGFVILARADHRLHRARFIAARARSSIVTRMTVEPAFCTSPTADRMAASRDSASRLNPISTTPSEDQTEPSSQPASYKPRPSHPNARCPGTTSQQTHTFSSSAPPPCGQRSTARRIHRAWFSGTRGVGFDYSKPEKPVEKVEI